LFVIKVPKDTNGVIEDLFPEKVLKTSLKGKEFLYKVKKNKKLNLETQYGKSVFASKVVKQQWKQIDFSKFESLFDAISKIISK